ncbi:MAG: polyprenyl synthetase family protein [Corynebacteriales bacterium]|nr:polyprenyl synthetase family protein [Mycobacteriales bacterium]
MTFVGPLGLTIEDDALQADLVSGLAEVEQILHNATVDDDDLIAQAASHLIEAGGKRFRPLLTLLCAQFGDPAAVGVVPVAAVMELTHLASLYHDDVMDSAEQRRGAPSANVEWGNKVAVLIGDLLFSRASALMAGLGDNVIRIQSETFARLVSGQIRETVGPRATENRVDHHRSVVRDKTGSLIATCCRLGSLLAGADEQTVARLAVFGEHIGVAFQVGDDILDIVSSSEQSGKTPGTDLREGVPTLPVLYALESSDPADERLRSLVSGPLDDDELLAEALTLLRAHPALDRVRADLANIVEQARKELVDLPECPAREALSVLCDAAAWRIA